MKFYNLFNVRDELDGVEIVSSPENADVIWVHLKKSNFTPANIAKVVRFSGDNLVVTFDSDEMSENKSIELSEVVSSLEEGAILGSALVNFRVDDVTINPVSDDQKDVETVEDVPKAYVPSFGEREVGLKSKNGNGTLHDMRVAYSKAIDSLRSLNGVKVGNIARTSTKLAKNLIGQFRNLVKENKNDLV